MATLTETAYYARKSVNIGIIVLVIVIVGRFAIIGALGIKDRLFPQPPPPANFALGPLPAPNFEGSEATPSGVTYTLETVTGTLPVMPKTVTVYSLVPSSRASFGGFDRMKEQASKMGFSGEPRKVEGSQYEVPDLNNTVRTLLIDELSGDFEIKYNFGADLGVFGQKDFKSKEEVVETAREFFSQLGLFTPDLATGSASVSYMKLDGQNLISTTSLANSDAVYVSFERAPVGESPVVYPNTKKGLVSALIVGNSDQNKGVLQARFYHSGIDDQSTGTYNPISSEEAFEKLKNGQAIFSSLPNPMPSTIPIRSVAIGYLDPFPPQSFLQPVIIFSDDRDFKAFVPAVKN